MSLLVFLRRLLWLAPLSFGASGCLWFSGDFNEPPKIERIEGPAALWRGEEGRFRAVVNDKDGGQLLHLWGVAPSCPGSAAEALELANREPVPNRTRQELPFKSTTAGPLCVFVIVADGSGAQSFHAKPFTVKGRGLSLRGPTTVDWAMPTAVYNAVLLDPDSNAEDAAATANAKFAWAQAQGCPEAKTAAQTGTAETGRTSFQLPRLFGRPFCVSVLVRDEFGAETAAEMQVTTINRPEPLVSLSVAYPMAPPPYGLFTQVRVGANYNLGVVDESVGAEWKITGPDGKPAPRQPCPSLTGQGAPAVSPQEACFNVDVAGSYLVELAVTDEGKVIKGTQEIKVEDTPPCIRETEPHFATAPKFFELYDRERVFRVIEVADDADPFPFGPRGNEGRLVWSIRRSDPGLAAQPFLPVVGNFRELVLPARAFNPGDRIEVRLEYFDRFDLATKPRANPQCTDKDPLCQLQPESGCYQRVTWTVNYL
jgi:hypothetical protein